MVCLRDKAGESRSMWAERWTRGVDRCPFIEALSESLNSSPPFSVQSSFILKPAATGSKLETMGLELELEPLGLRLKSMGLLEVGGKVLLSLQVREMHVSNDDERCD
jgi:hypothetical protein